MLHFIGLNLGTNNKCFHQTEYKLPLFVQSPHLNHILIQINGLREEIRLIIDSDI